MIDIINVNNIYNNNAIQEVVIKENNLTRFKIVTFMSSLNSLVSIIVVTYNSSNYIIETLDSIYIQTYKNIELIVSDDNSKDNTLILVNKWLNINKERFVRARVIESLRNTGVAPNLNRGLVNAQGEWIKSIAGDDTLEPTAIEEYIKFVELNSCEICFAKMRTFGVDKKANQCNFNFLENLYEDLRLPTRKQQYKIALKRHILPGPGIFYKKTFCEDIGGFNEKYPLAEEYDFQLRVLDRTKIYFLDKYLVNWRIRPNSLCHSIDTPISNDMKRSIEENRIPRMLKEHMYLLVWDYYIHKYIDSKKKNKLFVLYKLLLVFSPLSIKYKFFRKKG